MFLFSRGEVRSPKGVPTSARVRHLTNESVRDSGTRVRHPSAESSKALFRVRSSDKYLFRIP
jgi:hypothetical protein